MNPFESRKAPEKKESAVVGPIRACVIPGGFAAREWSQKEQEELREYREELQKLVSEQVDYYSLPARRDELGQKHGGVGSYVLSTISEKAKASRAYSACTGLAVVGVDAQTGENISFLTHQPPIAVLGPDIAEDFAKDLDDTLKEFGRRVKKDSVDAVIFGGSYHEYADITKDPETILGHDSGYKEIVKALARHVEEALHTEAHVIAPPNSAFILGHTDVVLDTKERRLYVHLPEKTGTVSGGGFSLPELDEATAHWMPLAERDWSDD